MSSLDRFNQTKEQLSRSFYSGEARHRLVTDRVPIWLHNAQLDPLNQFGPRWLLSISENSPDEPIGFLGLTANPWRDRFFEQLGPIEEPIGPLALVEITTRSGQVAYDLTAWEDNA